MVEIVKRLLEVYTEEGVAIWLGSRNRNLDDKRPIDLLAHGGDAGREAVITEIERMRA